MVIIWKVLKSSLVVITILIIIIVSYLIINRNNKTLIKLDSCIDGDTAWFIINGKREKVRFLGVDTPESTNIIEEYGIEASDYTCNMLKEAKNIYLEYDDNSDRYDKYDRVLGWVFVDNNNLSELLLTKGYAQVKYIYGDYLYLDELCMVQRDAYHKGIGIWNTEIKEKYKTNYCNKKYLK